MVQTDGAQVGRCEALAVWPRFFPRASSGAPGRPTSMCISSKRNIRPVGCECKETIGEEAAALASWLADARRDVPRLKPKRSNPLRLAFSNHKGGPENKISGNLGRPFRRTDLSISSSLIHGNARWTARGERCPTKTFLSASIFAAPTQPHTSRTNLAFPARANGWPSSPWWRRPDIQEGRPLPDLRPCRPRRVGAVSDRPGSGVDVGPLAGSSALSSSR